MWNFENLQQFLGNTKSAETGILSIIKPAVGGGASFEDLVSKL